MKIVIDARLYGLENAGLGRYAINLVRQLSLLDKKNKYFILLRKKYFQILKFPSNWIKVLVDLKHYSLKEQIELPKIITKLNPDIVHFLHFNVPIFYNGPFVVTIHDMLMHKQRGFSSTTLNPILYVVKRLGYKSVFNHAVKKALNVIVPSNSIKSELVNYFKLNDDKFAVTYQGVDEKIGNTIEADVLKQYGLTTPFFFYAGNAYPHKNLKRAIEAVVTLCNVRQRDAVFVLATSRGIFLERVKKDLKKLRAEKFVKLLGFVPDSELGTLFSSSAGFIYPSVSEGFGLQGLEAMSAGTILLASDIPVFKEVYGDIPIYFNPYDFSAIERAMERVLAMDEGERRQRIEKGRDFVKRYSWSKMAKQTLDVYEDCVNLRQG